MSFAEKQLAKFGWKSGDGLGKNRDGIKKSISVVKKNDTKGLGGKLDKWDFAWWDHVFNKSASNIQVSKDESGEIKVEKQATATIQKSKMGIISTSRPAGPTRTDAPSPATSSPSTMGSMTPRDEYTEEEEDKPAPAAKSGPSWLFGFVKASASSAVAEQSKRTNQEFRSSSDSFVARAGDGYDDLKASEADEYKDYTVKVSDQELFEACEGRTARKGARSEQPGKLGRVMKELLLDSGSDSSTTKNVTIHKEEKQVEKKKKKEKKEKKEKKDKKDSDGKSSKKIKEKKKDMKSKKDKKDKEMTENNDDKKKSEKTKKDKKDKKNKKEKASKEGEETSKKRKQEEDEPRTSKKSKKSKHE
ncbi:G patch domain-containing protein 4 [Haplosporangium sp. Z 27]|nr:G patch domain-containing protein 4 [Haplosporangium sp. Z 27]